MDWGVVEPTENISTRAVLDLGLRPTVRYFNELVFPGLGSVSFVKQISWSVLGLRLAADFNKTASRTAEAVEALACFIALRHHGTVYAKSPRIRGKRKLPSLEKFDFAVLSKRSNYVSNPFRAGTGSALFGLGLAEGESRRFNSLHLTDEGNRLAHLLLRKDKDDWLRSKWMTQSPQKISGGISTLLLPGADRKSASVTFDFERQAVKTGLAKNPIRKLMLDEMSRLGQSPGTKIANNKLVSAITNVQPEHARNLIAAFEFEQMREYALLLIRAVAGRVHEGEATIESLTKSTQIVDLFDQLHEQRDKLSLAMQAANCVQTEISKFLMEQSVKENQSCLRYLLERLPGIFKVCGVEEFVRKDVLFKPDLVFENEDSSESTPSDESTSVGETDWAPTPQRLINAFHLMNDCAWSVEQ